MGTRSPSHRLSLVTLETIAERGYLNAGGTKEYEPEEVNALIWARQSTAQERVAKEREARLLAEAEALAELPPPIPAEACEGYQEDVIIPHGTVRRSSILPPDATNFRIINARWNGKCRETGEQIWAGEPILWHKDHKTIYCETSEMFREYKSFFNIPF